ncbi:permease prefix domain 1-containing protein [Culicoidibacter larvae]|uniref:Uncharacterized protein n=1 Tax=Culicoidibacter larvae TaxID=2579976 RepID=A0A5R8QAU5_9FIRM|nr:permease prefix domain 1-containing protein [Culicoidibacter larvae]TLG72721.1 hypothetical protein FEZ08_08445 [Culicoidibacter larvae]
METIQNYVEVMFKDFPRTKAMVDLKSNILDTMENKYQALLAEGKSENEAVGMVISQFGNIDELKKEYGILDEQDDTVAYDYLTHDEVAGYIKFQKLFGKMLSLGVALILLGIMIMIFSTSTWFENMAALCFFLLLACAVALFIFFGMQSGRYKKIDRFEFRLTGDDIVWVTELSEKFRTYLQAAITIGTTIIILGVALTVFFTTIYPVADNLSTLPLFTTIIIGVYFFITAGIGDSAYKKLLQDKEMREEAEREARFGWLFGITMPLAAMLFLVLGLAFNLWYIAWIVFPIAAIGTTAVVQILNHTIRS